MKVTLRNLHEVFPGIRWFEGHELEEQKEERGPVTVSGLLVPIPTKREEHRNSLSREVAAMERFEAREAEKEARDMMRNLEATRVTR